MKLILFFLIVMACLGCGGSGATSSKGPPVMFNLTSTPVGGNADPSPLNTDTLIEIGAFKESSFSSDTLLQAFFSGQVERTRLLVASLPLEADLTAGATFEIGKASAPAQLSLDDTWTESFPSYVWGPFSGSVTVESRTGRVVTLRVDAIGEPDNEATGQIRIQGTITLDFSQQIEPPAE